MKTWDFSNCYYNVWHITCESILPLMAELDNILPGDTVVVPDYDIYPIELIKRILKDCNVVTKHIPYTLWPHLHANDYYRDDPFGRRKVPELTDKLLSYIDKKVVPHPSIVMVVRLHNKRWLPSKNIQELIDILCKTNNCEVILDPTYEEQLVLAYSTDYSMGFGGGSGCVYGQMVRQPRYM